METSATAVNRSVTMVTHSAKVSIQAPYYLRKSHSLLSLDVLGVLFRKTAE